MSKMKEYLLVWTTPAENTVHRMLPESQLCQKISDLKKKGFKDIKYRLCDNPGDPWTTADDLDVTNFRICTSYNLELLNVMNVLTGDSSYIKRHKEAYNRFGVNLSENSKNCLTKAVNIFGNTMLGPFLSNVISAVPNFEDCDVEDLF